MNKLNLSQIRCSEKFENIRNSVISPNFSCSFSGSFSSFSETGFSGISGICGSSSAGEHPQSKAIIKNNAKIFFIKKSPSRKKCFHNNSRKFYRFCCKIFKKNIKTLFFTKRIYMGCSNCIKKLPGKSGENFFALFISELLQAL